MNIIFLATPEFGAIILNKLAQTEYKPVLVVTPPDKLAGRKQALTPPPAKLIAKEYNIPVLQPVKVKECKIEIENAHPDLLIVAAYGNLVPSDVLEIAQFGSLALHPSLLPRYRGPSPIQTAILEGEKETGVTIFVMDEQIDHGKIVSSIRHQISDKETYESLSRELAQLGAKLLIETIPKWIAGEITPQPQDETKASHTTMIKKEDGKIDWNKPAVEIERQIRAFSLWPGSFTFWKKLQIKIIAARVVHFQTEPVGKIFLSPDNELAVQCGSDALVVEKLQLEGKNLMKADAFLRGNHDLIGTILQ